MAYGTVKVDTVTFTYASGDTSTTFSGLHASTTNNLTLSGTASANTFTGTTANFTNTNAQNISVTTLLSGLAITGETAGFTTVTGTTVTGTTANFASGVFTTQISGVTITGTTVAATTGTFTSLTGTTTNGTTASFTTGNFTSLTGTTTTGTTANFASGVFTTQVSGVTVIATTGTFTSLTGTTTTMTSGVFAAGTEPLPSISFVSDPNTGIYSPGADQLAVATNGTQRLTVDTAATTSTLPVVHPLGAEATPSITFTGDLNTGIFSPGADQVAISTNGSEKLIVLSDGKVGIGTSSPVGILHVQGIGDYTGSSTVAFLDGNSTGLYIGSHYDGSGAGVDFASRGYSSAMGDFRFIATNGSFAGNTTRMVIDSSGRVGIGTTSPAKQLHIENTSNDVTLRIGRNGYVQTDLIGSTGAGANDFKITQNGFDRFVIEYGGNSAARIDSSGRLLVGTSSANANGGVLQLSSGITFPATAVAASDANTLDDYEEGTWTASITGGTFAGLSTGRYTKIGRQVFAYLAPSTTAISGNLEISGLPFTSADRSSMLVATTPPTGITYSPTFVDTTTIYVNVSGTYSGGSVSTYFACVYQV